MLIGNSVWKKIAWSLFFKTKALVYLIYEKCDPRYNNSIQVHIPFYVYLKNYQFLVL